RTCSTKVKEIVFYTISASYCCINNRVNSDVRALHVGSIKSRPQCNAPKQNLEKAPLHYLGLLPCSLASGSLATAAIKLNFDC
ncbi:hypothetical protein, partial [Salmonella sp. s51933]|uniref:hypothetical protein n=1 Tax=Salmonella sp. s51933 TaxID=3160127 RepID=UPI0037551E82